MHSKLHVVADARGRPIQVFLSAGQTSDYVDARAMLASLPKAKVILADRGYDADWFRWALREKGIAPCIPSRRGGNALIPYDPVLYQRRHPSRTPSPG